MSVTLIMKDIARGSREVAEAEAAMSALLGRIAEQRDRDAFARLFLHYGPRLKSFMMHNGADAETAEDLVQETMLAAWSKAGLYTPAKGTVTTWLFTIARNLRIDRLRRQSAWHFTDLDGYDEPSREPRGDDELIRQERERQVAEGLEALPAEQMEVIALSYLNGLTQSEIADRLGLPLGTVKSRMRLAYQKLRQMLEDRV